MGDEIRIKILESGVRTGRQTLERASYFKMTQNNIALIQFEASDTNCGWTAIYAS